MPGSITDYLENAFLDHIFNASWTPPATVYLALGTALDDTGISGEPSGNGYNRQAITFNAPASRQVVQNGDVVFGPVTTASWGTLGKWGIYSAATGGNCMSTGDFSTPKSCPVGRSPRVNSGEVIVQLLAGAISTVWAHRLLNRAFRNITTGTEKPATFVALCETMPVDGDTDISSKEPSGNNYGRVQVNPNGGASPAWTLASAGALENQHQIDFPTPSGDWVIVAMAIASAVSAGELIVYADVTDETFGNGDPVNFPAGDLDITAT